MFHLKKILIDNPTLRSCTLRLYSLQNSNLTEWNHMKSNYSSRQLKQILNMLNQKNESELKKLGLSDEKIKLLESTKNDGNKYKSLDDLISSNIMQPNELNHICSNLMAKVAKKTKKIVSPAIDKKNIQSIKTAVGLRVKDRYISWSWLKLNGSQCSLLNWNCHELIDLSPNSTVPQIIQNVKDISQSIPDADAYVMERDSSRPNSKINIGILRSTVQHQQLLSILLTLLWAKNLNKTPDSDFFSSLYMIRPHSYAQLFRLFIGQEIVSTVDVVNDLLSSSNHDSLKYINSICCDETTTEQYYSKNEYMKEELGRSFLLTLTFFELAILDV